MVYAKKARENANVVNNEIRQVKINRTIEFVDDFVNQTIIEASAKGEYSSIIDFDPEVYSCIALWECLNKYGYKITFYKSNRLVEIRW